MKASQTHRASFSRLDDDPHDRAVQNHPPGNLRYPVYENLYSGIAALIVIAALR